MGDICGGTGGQERLGLGGNWDRKSREPDLISDPSESISDLLHPI